MLASQVGATSRHYWIAYAAACWTLVFAAFHIVWAAGWYIGLDPVQAPQCRGPCPSPLRHQMPAGGATEMVDDPAPPLVQAAVGVSSRRWRRNSETAAEE